jgi:hypothetical protein
MRKIYVKIVFVERREIEKERKTEMNAIKINAELKNVCLMRIFDEINNPTIDSRKREILKAEVKRREQIALAAMDTK